MADGKRYSLHSKIYNERHAGHQDLSNRGSFQCLGVAHSQKEESMVVFGKEKWRKGGTQ